MPGGKSKLLPVLLAALIAALGIHALIHHAGGANYVLSGEALDGENESDENEADDQESDDNESDDNESDDQESDGSAGSKIDCSIPDNQDDTGCDKGDGGTPDDESGDDSDEDELAPAQAPTAPPAAAPAPATSPRAPPVAPAADQMSDTDSGPKPRGGVPTGGGGTAR